MTERHRKFVSRGKTSQTWMPGGIWIPIWHTFSVSCATVHILAAEKNLSIVVFQGLAYSLIIALVQAI